MKGLDEGIHLLHSSQRVIPQRLGELALAKQVLSIDDAVHGADGRAGDHVELHAGEMEGMDHPGLVEALRAAACHHETALLDLHR